MKTGQSATPLKPRALLLDTNVWINSQLGTHVGYEDARRLLIRAREQQIRIGIAFHSLTDVFYVVRRELQRANEVASSGESSIPPDRIAAATKETAWGVIASIMEYAEVIGGDGSDARIALLHKNLHDDYEDDLVYAAARRMGADLIVSDDLAFVRHSPLPAMTSADALRWIEALS